MDAVSTFVSRLREIVGDEAVLDDAAPRDYYAIDALGGGRAQGIPPAVPPIAAVLPATTDEVAAVVRLASQAGLRIVPRGGGTGLMGGGRSGERCIVLDLSRMDRVREIDAIDGSAWVEAGCVLADADARARDHGLMLGHDPWTFGVATVGGALSTNGLGFLGGKYGSMGQQVLAVEAVLADGSIVRTRAPQPHSTGIDLARLFVGAEGQNGIVTAAALRLFPVPEARELRGWSFRSFGEGFSALVAMRRIGIAPAVLDYGERFDEQGHSGESQLYLGFDGLREEVAALMARSDAICRAHGGTPSDERDVREFWESRHAIAESFAQARRERRLGEPPPQRGGVFDYVHVALPVSRVLDYREQALGIARAQGVAVIEAGLWVTPGLFSLVLAHRGDADDAAVGAMAGAVDGCLRLAQDMGGAMEYCHGIGLRLAHLAEHEHGAGLAVMRAVKQALDPGALLNPDKAI